MKLYFCFDNRNADNADGTDMSDRIIIFLRISFHKWNTDYMDVNIWGKDQYLTELKSEMISFVRFIRVSFIRTRIMPIEQIR